MGLQRKTSPGIYTQGQQPYQRAALVEKGERTTLLWQSGGPVAVTQLMVPGA